MAFGYSFAFTCGIWTILGEFLVVYSFPPEAIYTIYIFALTVIYIRIVLALRVGSPSNRSHSAERALMNLVCEIAICGIRRKD